MDASNHKHGDLITMRMLLTILTLAATVLPAQVELTNICDRTPEVRDAIMNAASVVSLLKHCLSALAVS